MTMMMMTTIHALRLALATALFWLASRLVVLACHTCPPERTTALAARRK